MNHSTHPQFGAVVIISASFVVVGLEEKKEEDKEKKRKEGRKREGVNQRGKERNKIDSSSQSWKRPLGILPVL